MPDGTLFERASHARPRGALDLISKHIVPNPHVIAPPSDDSRPSKPAEESPARSPPPRPGHPPSNHPRKRTQKRLKFLTPPSANEQMQVSPHVGKIVDPDPEPTCHRSKRLAHGALVLSKRPGPASPLTRHNDMHRPSHANRALELATPPPDRAAVLSPRELGVDVSGEERALHLKSSIAH